MPRPASPALPRGTRVPATPYARRLARERGIALTALAGTGPNGRLTGRDVLSYVAPPEPSAASAVQSATNGPPPAALAATVSLEAVRSLLPQFDDFDPAIELIDVCLKAAAAALRSAPALAGGAIVLSWRDAEQDRLLAGLDRLTLGAISAVRHEPGDATSRPDGPVLAISWIDRDGIRPVAMPMTAGATARLVLAGSTSSEQAECLMSYDPANIDDTAAADFLLAFKTAMEVPLRLIA